MKKIITIGIAEDHPLVRQGLVSCLKPHKDIQILFEVADGKTLLEQLKDVRPAVILLDLEMPMMRASDLLKRLRSRYPKIRVVVVSAFFQKDYIVESFKLGVRAFLPKADKPETIYDAIVSVSEKGYYSDSEVIKVLAEELQRLYGASGSDNADLSESELSVLRLICKGIQRRKAAEILGVKPETVNFHMKNLMRKTNTDNSNALVSYAIQNKLVEV